MIENPFTKKKTIAQKVSNTVHLPKLPTLSQQKTTKQKIGNAIITTLIYAAIFTAGFVLSKVHTLLTVIG